MNISLVGSSFFAFKLISRSEEKRPLHVLLSVSALYFSLITLIFIALGIFGKITFLNVSVISYVIFALLWFVVRKNKVELEIFDGAESLSKSDLIFGICLLVPVAILMFLKLNEAILQIPLEFDAIAYHLPIVAEWLKTGDLMAVHYTAFAGPIGHYPSNFELFYLFSILPFNNDFLVNLLNFPLLALLTCTVYGICRNFGLDRKSALLAGVGFLYMPVFLQQAGGLFVDTFFTLTFALAIYFLQEMAKDSKRISNYILFGLSLGLCMGTKYLGLPYSAPLVLAFLYICFRKRANVAYLFLGAGAVGLTGIFFYIRNWINSGNPLFPVDVKILGFELFKGYPSANVALQGTALLDHIKSLETWKLLLKGLYTMIGWPGVIALVSFVVTAAILAVMLLRKRLFKKQDFITGMILVVIGGIFFLLYIAAPYSYRDLVPNVRYAMPFLVISAVNLGYVTYVLKKVRFVIFITFCAICIASAVNFLLMPIYKTRLDLRVIADHKVIAVVLLIGLIALLCGFLFRKSKKLIVSFCIFAIVAFSWATYVAVSGRESLAPYFYNSWYPEDNKYSGIFQSGLWFNKNEPLAKIAYAGFHLQYPLYGRGFEREAEYVNINECTDCRHEDYTNNSIRRDPNYKNWIRNLSIKHKQYLVVNPVLIPSVKSYEFEWASQHPEKFKLVQQYKDVYIYKIK